MALQLSCDHLSAIAKEHGGDTSACLREGLTLWLHGDYDTARHGPPTWRKLVDAVANSSGGNDLTLALEIAQNHNMHEGI